MKLFRIRKEIFNLINPVDDEGDPAFITPKEVKKRIENLEMHLDVKAENTIAYLKTLKAEMKAIDEAMRELEKQKRIARNKHEGLASFLMDTIRLAERAFNFGIHKARIQGNSQPSVVVHNEMDIPDRFIEIETKIKKRDILDWHKRTGEIPPGTDIVKGEHLRL